MSFEKRSLNKNFPVYYVGYYCLSSRTMSFNFPQRARDQELLDKLLENVQGEGVDLFMRLLEYDPHQRLTMDEALNHLYITKLMSEYFPFFSSFGFNSGFFSSFGFLLVFCLVSDFSWFCSSFRFLTVFSSLGFLSDFFSSFGFRLVFFLVSDFFDDGEMGYNFAKRTLKYIAHDYR